MSTETRENEEPIEPPGERHPKSSTSKPIVPDGGWGWVIVFSSFMIHFIMDG